MRRCARGGRRWLGVEHVFLTDNAQGGEVVMGDQLQDFIDEGFVTFTPEPASGLLGLVRWRCLQAGRARGINWMANIDLDEFIVLRNTCARMVTSCSGPALSLSHRPASSAFAQVLIRRLSWALDRCTVAWCSLAAARGQGRRFQALPAATCSSTPLLPFVTFAPRHAACTRLACRLPARRAAGR